MGAGAGEGMGVGVILEKEEVVVLKMNPDDGLQT